MGAGRRGKQAAGGIPPGCGAEIREGRPRVVSPDPASMDVHVTCRVTTAAVLRCKDFFSCKIALKYLVLVHLGSMEEAGCKRIHALLITTYKFSAVGFEMGLKSKKENSHL